MTIAETVIEKLVDFVFHELNPSYEKKKLLMKFTDEVLPDYLVRAKNDNLKTKTFLHRSTPINIYNIYQPLRLKFYNGNVANDDITTLFNCNNYISIIGRAGSGKSLLVNHFLLTSIEKGFGIPVKIYLRKVRSKGFIIEEEIAKSLYTSNISVDTVITLLEEGKFVLLFDGYDEISLRSHVSFNEYFVDFLSKYPHNKFVLTSRPYSGSENLPKFCKYSIVNFSNDEIDHFIRKQIKDPEIASNVIASVGRCSYDYIRSYLSNSLLLSVYILISRKSIKMPKKQHYFYRRVIDTLFEEHDLISKVGHYRELASGLVQEEIEMVLQMFSLFSYFSQKIYFDKRYFYKKLNEIRELNRNNKIGFGVPNFDNHKMLHDLKVSISLFVEDDGQLSFIHRSIQEYFIVSLVYNLDRYDSKEQMYGKILDRIKNRKSYEIHTLLSLFSDMDKTNYYKFLLNPALKHITNNIFDASGCYLYESLLKFIFESFVIKYDYVAGAYDNYFMQNPTWLFPIEHLQSFGLLIEHIKGMLNSKSFLSHMNDDKKRNKDFICSIIGKNRIVKELLKKLFDDIIDYKTEITEYIKNSGTFNQDVVNMFDL